MELDRMKEEITKEEYNNLSDEDKKHYCVDHIFNTKTQEGRIIYELKSVRKKRKENDLKEIEEYKNRIKEEDTLKKEEELSLQQRKEEIIINCIQAAYSQFISSTDDMNENEIFELLIHITGSIFCSFIVTLFNHIKQKDPYDGMKEDMEIVINNIAQRVLKQINSQDILIEIRSEEIPAKMQKKARQEAKNVFKDVLKKHGIDFDSVEAAKEHIRRCEGK